MALDANITLNLSGNYTKALDLGTAKYPLSVVAQMLLADGTGASQADRIFTDTRTIADASPITNGYEDLDLAGSLADAYGATLTFARIKFLMIKAASANTNPIQVLRPSSNGVPLFVAAGDGITIRPGGFFAWAASDATAVVVTASTGDLLRVANTVGGSSVSYDIVIIGASA